jgi:hypothetical protein
MCVSVLPVIIVFGVPYIFDKRLCELRSFDMCNILHLNEWDTEILELAIAYKDVDDMVYVLNRSGYFCLPNATEVTFCHFDECVACREETL